MKPAFMLPVLMLCCVAPSYAAMKPTDLRCESLVNPLGIDAVPPRLSWQLQSTERAQRQTAYRIVVASSRENLRAGRGDLWDSGKIASDNSLYVPYTGAPLRSAQRAFWKVRVWDQDGKASAYSPAAWWEMGLLKKQDRHGSWIGRETDTVSHPAPLFRRAFTLSGKVKSARVTICGLGYYELRLNGKKVGDHMLDPGYTRYDRRDLYAVYDVTRQLQEGENAVGVILGSGWHNVFLKTAWDFDAAPWRSAPKVLAELRVEMEDGHTLAIATDDTWKSSTGPIVWDSIYGGETYDARLEKTGWDAPGYDDSAWQAAKLVDAPKGVLSAQQNQPIKVGQVLTPVKITEPKPGVFVFDMGQNFAGLPRLTVKGPAGTAIVMKFGERLHPDGTLDQTKIAQHVSNAQHPQTFQTDTYILKGKGTEVYEPRFTYHGFQYVEVTGFPGKPTPESLRGLFLHSAIESAGEFSCSNPLLNRIQEATRRSYLSNLQGIPTDCPHREKNGWTGDAHLAAEQGLFNYAPIAVYTKWIRDLDDEQKPTGELPGIVPTSGWGYAWGNGPAWDSAYLLIPWYVYEYCGDANLLKTHYPGMRRYVDYLTTKANDGIVSIGLGDWVPYETDTPVSVTSTGYYYRDARIVAKTAKLLGNDEDARKYTALAESIKASFRKTFVNAETGEVANSGQTSLSCALYQDLLASEERPAVLRALVAAVDKRGGHIDTGILGAKYVLNALLEEDRNDVAYRVASQETLPGWGWWIKQGATTLWEDWKGEESLNHIMFGDISAWFYKALAGIVLDPEAPGFRHFTIKPHIVGGLTFARAAYHSVRGEIVSDWKLAGGQVTLQVRIPANTTATVFVPAKNAAGVTESGKPAAQAAGVKSVREIPGYAVYEVGSGSYTFAAPIS